MSQSSEPLGVAEMMKAAEKSVGVYRRQMINIKPLKKAEAMLRDYCATQLASIVGMERNVLQREISDTQEQADFLKKDITRQRTLVEKTDKTIAVKDKEAEDMPDAQQRSIQKYLDMALAVMCGIGGMIAVYISMQAMQSVIFSSGIPVFIEKPEFGKSLSLLLPLGALAFEFFKRYLPNDRAKRRYVIGVYSLTCGLLLVWIVLFALIFGSVADQSIDLDVLMGSSNSDDPLMTAFTIIQLATEFMVGCSFFITAGDIIKKYMPQKNIDNPAYLEEKQRLAVMEDEYNQCMEAVNEKRTRDEKLEHGSTLYISEQLAAFHQLRAQFFGTDDI